MPFEMHQWVDLAPNFSNTILLGNGASIAVSEQFSYSSLLTHAIENQLLAPAAQSLFDSFDTQDFELILRLVWQASNVNRSLGIADERTHAAYVAVRNSLIEAVRSTHPEHHEVRDHLPRINRFLRNFKTVISLNYDLIVYWASTLRLDEDRDHQFKDCFIHGSLHDDWPLLRTPIYGARSTTLVFYPHGSLLLCRDKVEEERKIHNRGGQLLSEILRQWEGEELVPLFVSEGMSEQKIRSIQSSYYLSTVYREVLMEPRTDLTIYGWGFGEHDKHILKKMARSGIERIAV